MSVIAEDYDNHQASHWPELSREMRKGICKVESHAIRGSAIRPPKWFVFAVEVKYAWGRTSSRCCCAHRFDGKVVFSLEGLFP